MYIIKINNHYLASRNIGVFDGKPSISSDITHANIFPKLRHARNIAVVIEWRIRNHESDRAYYKRKVGTKIPEVKVINYEEELCAIQI